MALRVLLTWELGGGFGHLATLHPLARTLLAGGHHVFLASRNIRSAGMAFADLSVSVLPAPIAERTIRLSRPPASFADILMAEGYSDVDALRFKVAIWLNLIDLIRPHCVVSDYSPTALLALRCRQIPTVVVGTGFYTPPDVSPLPLFRQVESATADEVICTEHAVLDTVNRVLEACSGAPLTRLSQLQNDVAINALTTFSELDHYPNRRNDVYWGAWEQLSGSDPNWSTSTAPRVFAYLKRSPERQHVLAALEQLHVTVLAYAPDINPAQTTNERLANVTIVRQPLDMHAVAKSCDVAICHGGHGTTAALLLAGKPMLFLPLWQEQQLIADNVIRLGGGLSAPISQPNQIVEQLQRVLTDTRYQEAATAFASKYATFDPQLGINQLVSSVEAYC